MKRDGLSNTQIWAYSMGHFSNDVQGCLFFAYSPIYLINVIKLNEAGASLGVLAGQITDGLWTPIVGILSDKYSTRIGNMMPWYILGAIGTIPTFLAQFTSPSFIVNDSAT